MSIPQRSLVAALFVLAGADGLRGQVVVGRIQDAAGEPVAAAFVTLTDPAGTRVAGGLSGDDGRYVLRAPAAGRYTVRVEVIGYGTASSPVELTRPRALRHDVTMAPEPVELDALTVASQGRGCRALSDGSAVTQRLWDEARKALRLVEWSERETALLYDVEIYRRRLELYSLDVRSETVDTLRALATSRPFRTLSARALHDDGYIQRGAMESGPHVYYAPDAGVVLSDVFLDSHCFRAETDPTHPGLVGLGFEPRQSRRVADVEGVLWLDATTTELRSLEYRYTRLPRGLRARHVGGRLEFLRLPSGKWIISRWWIRAPQLSPRRRRVTGLEESGGRLLRATTVTGEIVAGSAGTTPPEPPKLVGVVIDQATGEPVPGALVTVDAETAVADSAGAFTLRLEPGAYPVRAEALGYAPRTDSVVVPGGRTSRVELRLPVAPLAVDPVGVRVARSPLLELRGFYARRDARPGRFLTSEDLAPFGGMPLHAVPQLGLAPDPQRGVEPAGRGPCQPAVFLNGRRLEPDNAPTVLSLLSAEDLEGAEIYRSPASTPREFTEPGYCGAVVLWTKP